MRIHGPPSSTPFEIGMWLAGQNATTTFARWMCTRLWAEATLEGLDPVGVICQSAKETGFGRFGGAVEGWMHNTCGLKVERPDRVPGGPDSQFAHASFATWIIGARAHVQHLVAYLGGRPSMDVVDPRFELVGAPAVVEWAELGGRWAPSATYGQEIESMMRLARRP